MNNDIGQLRNTDPALGRLWVQFSAQTASELKTLKVVPTAAMSDAGNLYYE